MYNFIKLAMKIVAGTIIIVAILSTASAVNRELNYFYGDQWQIGYAPIRRISYETISSTNYDFWGIKQFARDRWTSAGFTSTLSHQSISTIHIIGGRQSIIEATYSDYQYTFQANVGRNRDGSVTYNNRTIPLYKHDNVRIYFPELPWYYFFTSVNHYRHAMLHELGHAFGWRGHSTHSSDVMYDKLKGPTTLTTRDINHIYQIIGP